MTNTDKTFDSWLVLQCQAGNKKATGLLVKRWHKKLCKQSYWYTKDMDLAKDIVQDCWSIIIKKIHKIRDTNSFGSWALSIVTRKTIDRLRKQKREIKNLENYYDTATNALNGNNDNNTENVLVLLRKSIKKLPEQQQAVLHLFYLEELTIKEIGEIMQLPLGTIKSRLFNAREKLKIILKNRYHEK